MPKIAEQNEETFTFPENIPRAQVTNSGGEMSMSLEETNRIRAALGMKPLNMTKPKQMEIVAGPTAEEQEEEAKQMKEIETAERIRQARAERKLKETKSIAEVEDTKDVSSWVERSRKLEVERKRAEERKRVEEEEEKRLEAEAARASAYTAKDLRGMKVSYMDAGDLMEGQEVVLTLRDSKVTGEDEDELENVHMIEKAKLDKNLQRKKQTKAYDPDAELTGGKKSLLAQYDDDSIETTKKTMILDGSGEVNEAARRRREEVKRRLAGEAVDLGRVEYDLEMERKVVSEFYTAEEMTQFKKTRDPNKPKKMRRKRRTDNDEDDEGGAAPMNLGPVQDEAADHGKRADVKKRAAEEAYDDKVNRLSRFENAVAAASVKSAANLGKTAKVDDLEDEQLAASLSRARRAANTQTTRSVDVIAAQARVKIEEKEITDGGSAVVFDPTNEFVRQIQVDVEEPLQIAPKIHENKPKAKAGPERPPAHDGGDDMEEDDVKPDVEMQDADEEGSGDGDDGEDNGGYGDEEEKAEFTQEPLARSSMSAALALLKSRGNLEAEMDIVGRNNDKSVVIDRGEYDFHLDYKDAKGRILSQKEAYRRMSHKFHGKKPGKNKQEKLAMKLYDESRTKNMGSGDTPLHTTEKVALVQERSQTAHLVLSGKAGLSGVLETADISKPKPRPTAAAAGALKRGDRDKVSMSLGKRKAEDDGNASPSKRPPAIPEDDDE